MNKAKKDDVSFTHNGKESIRDRIKSLFKGRSLRKVSLDWGLPYSTLNNYFSRSATPSVEILVKICELENVSLTWLATGDDGFIAVDEAHKGSINQESAKLGAGFDSDSYTFGFTATPLKDDKFLSLTWAMFFEALDHDEKQKIIDIYAKIGVRGVLNLLSQYNESTSALIELPQEEQLRLLRIHEQMKKGSSEADQQAAETGLASSDKKAG
ncbi:TPA: helix-turn-helix transcriptional regulator [Kluyvera ascorbata]|nr:helix-turn-helix transcriptional regulator [Citrobacter freundii]HCL5620268.1 helix-turn-helix transcriptional regulator [Kluyvera ascorbata]HED3200665.1 helix-turn-helix transcriptional regulator [Kluyvera ascorbata]HED4087628.1 helix-turn-helix transcriptional regulator [Kluyvera ascorbata]